MANLLASQRANPYRVRAYRKAADAILTVTGDLADLGRAPSASGDPRNRAGLGSED
jgi:DNA polymerase/3'-5' exonuclease PolX